MPYDAYDLLLIYDNIVVGGGKKAYFIFLIFLNEQLAIA